MCVVWRLGRKESGFQRAVTVESNGSSDREMSAYEYDIFFSYKRNSRNQFWISQVSGLVKQWLREEGVDSAQVFVDVESIETGDHWPTRLSEALAKSKCMI